MIADTRTNDGQGSWAYTVRDIINIFGQGGDGKALVTEYAIRKAREHAANEFPGAPVPPRASTRRNRTSDLKVWEHAAWFATKLSVLEANRVNVANEQLYVKSAPDAQLLVEYQHDKDAFKHGQFGDATMSKMLAMKQLVTPTMESCACGNCVDNGHRNVAELQATCDRLEDLCRTAGLEACFTADARQRMQNRLKELLNYLLVRYRRRELSALEHSKGCTSRCRNFALSDPTHVAFCSPCSPHDVAGEVPHGVLSSSSVYGIPPATPPRKDLACDLCVTKGGKRTVPTKNFVCCASCSRRYHEKCLISDNYLVPGQSQIPLPFYCASCRFIVDHDTHVMSDAAFNEMWWIRDDLLAISAYIKTQNHDARLHLQLSYLEKVWNRGLQRCLKLASHCLVQAHFQTSSAANGSTERATEDYAGKLEVQRIQTKLLETQRRSISAHITVFSNTVPDQSTRDAHPEYPWEAGIIPPPTDAGQPFSFSVVVFSNNTSQTGRHTNLMRTISTSVVNSVIPWQRLGDTRHDGANNYTDANAMHDLWDRQHRFGSDRLRADGEVMRTSIAGEGKNASDAKGSETRRVLKKGVKCGYRGETASDFARICNMLGARNTVYIAVDLHGDVTSESPAVGGSECHYWKRVTDGILVQRYEDIGPGFLIPSARIPHSALPAYSIDVDGLNGTPFPFVMPHGCGPTPSPLSRWVTPNKMKNNPICTVILPPLLPPFHPLYYVSVWVYLLSFCYLLISPALLEFFLAIIQCFSHGCRW